MKQDEAMKWIADVLEEDVAKIAPETKREALERWDSLGMLTLIAALDDQFSVVLDEDEMVKLTTVGNILDVLRKYKILDSDS
jgi:acyl carrier protein